MSYSFRNLWLDEDGQDIAEYSVMLAVILGNCRRHRAPDRVERRQRVLAGGQLDSVAGTFSRPIGDAAYWPAALSSLLATFTPLNPSTYFAIP